MKKLLTLLLALCMILSLVACGSSKTEPPQPSLPLKRPQRNPLNFRGARWNPLP